MWFFPRLNIHFNITLNILTGDSLFIFGLGPLLLLPLLLWTHSNLKNYATYMQNITFHTIQKKLLTIDVLDPIWLLDWAHYYCPCFCGHIQIWKIMPRMPNVTFHIIKICWTQSGYWIGPSSSRPLLLPLLLWAHFKDFSSSSKYSLWFNSRNFNGNLFELLWGGLTLFLD